MIISFIRCRKNGKRAFSGGFEMAKKSWNTFVKAHRAGICVQTIIDWHDPKGQTSPKGLVFPSGQGMLVEFLKQHLKDDWAIKSVRGKVVRAKRVKGSSVPKPPPVFAVQIILKTQGDLAILGKFLAITPISGRTPALPCTSACHMSYDSSDYVKFANSLGY